MTKPLKDVVPCKDDNPPLDPQVLDEVVSNLATSSDDKRRQKFALYWLLGLSVRQAALKAGYSERYANSGVYKYIGEGSRFRREVEAIVSKIPERYRQICQARLVTVAEIEGRVLEAQLQDPDKAMKHPQILKQVKQAAGALAPEESPSPPSINIGKLQAILAQTLVMKEEENKD